MTGYWESQLGAVREEAKKIEKARRIVRESKERAIQKRRSLIVFHTVTAQEAEERSRRRRASGTTINFIRAMCTLDGWTIRQSETAGANVKPQALERLDALYSKFESGELDPASCRNKHDWHEWCVKGLK